MCVIFYIYWGVNGSGLSELYTDASSNGQFQCFRVLFVPIRDRQNLQRCSIDYWDSWRRSRQTTRRRLKEHVGGALSRLLPWSHTLHKIEGDCRIRWCVGEQMMTERSTVSGLVYRSVRCRGQGVLCVPALSAVFKPAVLRHHRRVCADADAGVQGQLEFKRWGSLKRSQLVINVTTITITIRPEKLYLWNHFLFSSW